MPRLNGLRMSRLILILLVHSSASLKQIRLAGNPFSESEGRVEVLDENGNVGYHMATCLSIARQTPGAISWLSRRGARLDE